MKKASRRQMKIKHIKRCITEYVAGIPPYLGKKKPA
jgi:hypothetical protein